MVNMMRAVQYSTYGGDGPSSLQADTYPIRLLTLILSQIYKVMQFQVHAGSNAESYCRHWF
jgi:hypothetical protein